MTVKVLVVFLAAFFAFDVKAQGQNNDFEYDQDDLEFLFKQNKIDVFKFNFRAEKDTCLNVIFAEYKSGKLSQEINFYENCKPLLAMLDESFTNFFPRLNDSTDTGIRFYFKNTAKGVEITPVIGDIQATYKFSDVKYNGCGSRAFDKLPAILKGRQPLVAFYANAKGNHISCPGDAKASDVPKLYSHVVIVYVDLIPVRK